MKEMTKAEKKPRANWAVSILIRAHKYERSQVYANEPALASYGNISSGSIISEK